MGEIIDFDGNGPIPGNLKGVNKRSNRYKDLVRFYQRLLSLLAEPSESLHKVERRLPMKAIVCEKVIFKVDKTRKMESEAFRGKPIEYGVYVQLCNSLTGDLNRLGWESEAEQETALHAITGGHA